MDRKYVRPDAEDWYGWALMLPSMSLPRIVLPELTLLGEETQHRQNARLTAVCEPLALGPSDVSLGDNVPDGSQDCLRFLFERLPASDDV